MFVLFFFFNDPPTTEIYTLSLHDALPISAGRPAPARRHSEARHRRDDRTRSRRCALLRRAHHGAAPGDRKSTRLNSSHTVISYAVFCLKKKKTRIKKQTHQCDTCTIPELT